MNDKGNIYIDNNHRPDNVKNDEEDVDVYVDVDEDDVGDYYG